MTYTTRDLFDVAKLPAPLAAFLETCPTPLEALNRLPELLQFKGQTIKGTVQDGAVLQGDIWIEEGAFVHAGAVLEGPVYVGKNTKVGPHASLRNGVYLGDECVIGHGADIKNTLAVHGAKIQINTFAGDSVLGRGARVGSGAVLSNRKFNQTNIKVDFGNGPIDSQRDFLGAFLGDQSRVGANVTLSPGSIVGAYTWIGSGCVIQGSVPADSLVTVKQELDVKPKPRTELKSGLGEYYTM
ncbi:MAG: DapH/DapD/GlmU-related protein [Alphaproteobacteria bacterium]